MIINQSVDSYLQEYGNKVSIKCDIDSLLDKSVNEVSSLCQIPFSNISLNFGSIETPFCKFNPETNELIIYIFPRWFYPHTTKKERDCKVKYILSHEIIEASMKKPSKINQIFTKSFSSLLPDFSELRTELNDESLILQCQNIVSDINADKLLIALNDEKKGNKIRWRFK